MPEPSLPQTFSGLDYGRGSTPDLRLDASIPGGAGPFPAAIIVHGGGWVAGDRRRNVEPLFPILEAAGMAWFSISYTLAHDISQFGSAVHDVVTAIDFVVSNAARFRVDTRRIILIGESAGGQLATMAALRAAHPAVQAVVAFYTPFDLEHLVGASPFGGMLARAFPPNGSGNWRDRLRELSPLKNLRPGMPPFLLIHGTDDPVVPFNQSETMCRAVRAAGGSCDLIAVRRGGHGLRFWESAGLNGYKRLMTEWLNRRLNTRTTGSAAPAAR